MKLFKMTKNILTGILLTALAAMMVGTVSAKSLYVIANHHTAQFDAWNINPDGTATFQSTINLTHAGDPGGIAVDADSNTLFITSEFDVGLEIVDATTLTSLGFTGTAYGLAGVDVDDANNIVYTVDRCSNDLYAYDWDADNKDLTLKTGFPIDLPSTTCAMGLAFDDTSGQLWVSDNTSPGTARAYNVNTWTEVKKFTPSHRPVGIAVDGRRGHVYTVSIYGSCGGYWGGSHLLSKYDLATDIETTIDMGHGGVDVAVDETSGLVYATGGCDGDQMEVWNTSTSPFSRIQQTADIGSPAGLVTGNVSFNPLNLSKDDGLGEDSCVASGAMMTYDICYDNTTNSFPVDNVSIVDNLPTEVEFDSATGGGVYDSGSHKVNWDIGLLAAGELQQCQQLRVKVKAGTPPLTTITNYATIDSDETAVTTISEETETCDVVPVSIDIKPESCRNPINTKDKGVLPVAVVGTEDFDVSQIDPETVALEGVSPLRWAMEDVATPYELPEFPDAYSCTTEGADGYMDLSFKFKAQEVVSALGMVSDGDVLVLEITGNLMTEYGGTPIAGGDVVVILKKTK